MTKPMKPWPFMNLKWNNLTTEKGHYNIYILNYIKYICIYVYRTKSEMLRPDTLPEDAHINVDTGKSGKSHEDLHMPCPDGSILLCDFGRNR